MDGGSTDAMKTHPAEKKVRNHFFWPPDPISGTTGHLSKFAEFHKENSY